MSHLDADEVVRRLCILQRDVSDLIGWDHAADCFCIESPNKTYEDGYRNEGKALEFIEQAVREKIKQELDATNKERNGLC